MTSELADTLLGLRWPLPRTDHDARAALDQLAQVSGRLTDLVADPAIGAQAPSWLGPVQALIAQGGFTLDWWQPLLAEPDLDWTVNHQAHLSADLAQIAAAGARILDQLLPSGEPAGPPPVVRSVASFGSVPMAPPTATTVPNIPPVLPSAPPPPAPTGPPLLQPGVPGVAGGPGAGAGQGPSTRGGSGGLPPGAGIPAQPRQQEFQPPRFVPEPERTAAPAAAPAPPIPDLYEPEPSSRLPVSDPMSDSGRHRKYEYGSGPSSWRENAAERSAPDLFPSPVHSYPDDEDDDDPILAPGRRLPAHAGVIAQATVVLCVVGALSWWAVGELHKPPSTAAAAGPSGGPTGAGSPSAAPTGSTAAAGLNPPPATKATAPAQTRPPAAGGGSNAVSNMSVLLEGGSASDPYIDVIVTFAAANTGPVTITIDYYGTSNGNKVSPQTSVLHESGQTGYQVGTTIPSTAYCGTKVTVIASSGETSSQATTEPGC